MGYQLRLSAQCLMVDVAEAAGANRLLLAAAAVEEAEEVVMGRRSRASAVAEEEEKGVHRVRKEEVEELLLLPMPPLWSWRLLLPTLALPPRAWTRKMMTTTSKVS